MKNNIEVIFWDFDGVLMNSNEVRDRGFEEVLKEYPREQVEKLLDFHRKNGGLSRYVKFHYFFEEIRNEPVTEEEVADWARRFSMIMKELLVNSNLLIEETLDFIKREHSNYKMHIVSGSDQEELRYLCSELKIEQYFDSINGSPKPKTKWVGELIEKNIYNTQECILIGDSRNDFDAAQDNEIAFVGYGNDDVIKLSDVNWEGFKG